MPQSKPQPALNLILCNPKNLPAPEQTSNYSHRVHLSLKSR